MYILTNSNICSYIVKQWVDLCPKCMQMAISSTLKKTKWIQRRFVLQNNRNSMRQRHIQESFSVVFLSGSTQHIDCSLEIHKMSYKFSTKHSLLSQQKSFRNVFIVQEKYKISHSDASPKKLNFVMERLLL